MAGAFWSVLVSGPEKVSAGAAVCPGRVPGRTVGPSPRWRPLSHARARSSTG